MVEFMVGQMNYNHHIVEKDNGLSASAIFWKADQFECVEKGKINLQLDPTTMAPLDTQNIKDGKYGCLYCVL